MKNKYLIQVTDLRIQVDHINPKKFQLYTEYRGSTENYKSFMILSRHKKTRMITDRNKITDVNIIWVLNYNT